MSAWPIKQLRHIAMVNPATPASLDLAEEVSFLPMEAIGVFTPIESSRTRPVHEVKAGYTYFEDGDVAFAKVTPCFENGKGAIFSGLTGGKGFGTTEITVLRPAPSTDPRFLAYLVQSQAFVSFGESVMQGSGGLKRVPDNHVRGFKHVVPSPAVQTAVANYLDRQTAAIDALIAKKEELLGVLGRYRQAVITKAVTCGVAVPNVKHSRVRLGLYATAKSGDIVSKQELADEGFPAYGANRQIGYSLTANYPKGALSLGRVGSCGAVNRHRKPVFISDNALVISVTSPKLQLDFLEYVLRVADFSEFITQGAMPLLTGSSVRKLQVPLPSPREQLEIVEYLNERTSRIDALIGQCGTQITTLSKFRASVISAAVTGKAEERLND